MENIQYQDYLVLYSGFGLTIGAICEMFHWASIISTLFLCMCLTQQSCNIRTQNRQSFGRLQQFGLYFREFFISG